MLPFLSTMTITALYEATVSAHYTLTKYCDVAYET